MRRLGTIALLVGGTLLAAGALGGAASAQDLTMLLRLRAELQVRNPERPAARLEPLPLVEERVHARIDGQHATTELEQVFRNQTGSRLEGRYVLRPSMDARVEGFAYYIGEERIEGEVLERRSARRVYDTVTRRRRDPAILEQTADGEFTFRVFPIEPGEDKRIETTFSEWLSRRGDRVTYRVPVPSGDAQIDVTLTDARARHVRSPSHAIDVESVPGGLRIRARRPRSQTDELVLRWDIDEPEWSPRAYVHRDEGQAGYFLVSLAAPEGYEDRVADKDVTLVLDRSGSMAGEAIAHARAAASDVIRRLGAGDRLNVIAFDDDVDPLWNRPRAAHAQSRADALDYVARLRAGGGTDIAYALQRAFASQDEEPGRPRVVIFLTDGQSDAGAALAAAQREQRDVRVFTVGVGGGVNRALLSRLAAEKRGTFTYIDRASRIEADVGHLYAQISRPLLVGVSLEVEGAVASRIYPRTLPDLFLDDELVIAGRFRGEPRDLRFVLRGRLGEREMTMRTSADPRASGRRAWVGRRWAIERVDHLLERIQLEGARPELREEVTSLALAYNFVTPYTAFLAIPAREVTAEAAQTLNQARAQRQQAQMRHQDATALSTGGDGAGEAVMAEEEADWDDDADFRAAGAPEPALMEAADGGVAGCASCTVGAPRPTPSGLWLAPLAVALFLWRRRRAG